jgi:hypothetical protein
MGREIRRVPLDFTWPLNMPWKGFMCPYQAQECQACDRSGYNPETKQISDDWYDFPRSGRRWVHNITQDEVQALVDAGRLYDFTHELKEGSGWILKDPPVIPTAEQVNEWSKHGFRHDSINHHICVETRAKRLGVWGKCPICEGNGEVYFNEEIQAKRDAWYESERYVPPTGEGWQLWETVSEGSPISPVFPTKEEFLEYILGEGYSREDAESFLCGLK